MTSVIGLYGDAIQREYDLKCEIEEYLKIHPKASIVNLGCGLLDIFVETNNKCFCYNIDFPSVIEIRNKLMPPKKENIILVMF